MKEGVLKTDRNFTQEVQELLDSHSACEPDDEGCSFDEELEDLVYEIRKTGIEL